MGCKDSNPFEMYISLEEAHLFASYLSFLVIFSFFGSVVLISREREYDWLLRNELVLNHFTS